LPGDSGPSLGTAASAFTQQPVAAIAENCIVFFRKPLRSTCWTSFPSDFQE